MTIIRDPRKQPAAGDRLLRNGCCRMVVGLETELTTIRAVKWVDGHRYKTLRDVTQLAKDTAYSSTAYSSTAGSWRAWAKDGASILTEVKVA